MLDVLTGGVEHYVVVAFVAPLQARIKGVIAGARFVDRLDATRHLPPCELALLLVGAGKTTAYAAVVVGIDENAEGVLVTQNVVGTATDDDTIGLGGKLLDDVALRAVHHLRLAESGVVACGKAVAHRDGIEGVRFAFHHLPNVLLRQRGFACDFGEDFFVVIIEPQLLSKAPAKFPSATAELPAYCDYLHKLPPKRKS